MIFNILHRGAHHGVVVVSGRHRGRRSTGRRRYGALRPRSLRRGRRRRRRFGLFWLRTSGKRKCQNQTAKNMNTSHQATPHIKLLLITKRREGPPLASLREGEVGRSEILITTFGLFEHAPPC